jgi:hypothetical protein
MVVHSGSVSSKRMIQSPQLRGVYHDLWPISTLPYVACRPPKGDMEVHLGTDLAPPRITLSASSYLLAAEETSLRRIGLSINSASTATTRFIAVAITNTQYQ